MTVNLCRSYFLIWLIISGYNTHMYRNALRVVFVLSLLLLAISIPVVSSGYFELQQASTSSSYIEMAEHYVSAARRIPWRTDLYELAGHAYYHAEKYSLADAAYQKAFQSNVLSAEGWLAWGDVNYLDADAERASEVWAKALEQPNPSGQLYSRLSQIYDENADYPKAAQYLQKYVAIRPDGASAHYRLGLLLTLSDPNRALSELTTASQLDRQLDPAVQTLRTALNLAELNGSTSERFVIIGRGLGLVEEWPLAHAAFERAVSMDRKNAEAWAWLGEANQHTELPERGSEELDRALSLNPNSAIVRGLRGLYFQRVGNFQGALTEFQTAARLETDNPAWQVSMGEAHSKLGDLIRALEAYQTATTLLPDDAGYWRLLAIFCAQNNVNIKDVGVPAAQKAVVLAKEDATSFDVLGWLLLLDARHDEAERTLMRALELDSQNASAYLHLGMVYLQKDDRVSAYDHLVKARDLGNAEAEVLLNQYFP
jgi:tetratricopeptide (TPR) repeat protein